MDLQRQKKLRDDFLIALWELHAGNYGGDVSTTEVCKKIDVDYDTEGSIIGQYLYKRGWVAWSSFDWISLTTEGIVEAERLVEEREKLRADIESSHVAQVKCPKCNHRVSGNARFCESCGASLTKFTVTTAEDTTQRPAAPSGGTDPLIGRELDGKYKILARLGQGGVGAVYRAERLSLRDDVAIKVLHQDFASDPAFIERFRREAMASAIARHRNIVHIYEYVARHGDSPDYIVMEYVRGRSLRTVLEREGRLEVNRAVSLMREICSAIGAAHSAAISHRDLKPANIIIAEPSSDSLSEEIKVIDFGIAKLHNIPAEEGVTEVGTVLGTPQYMSPEQCRGAAANARSDVYSLGVMLYEMLSGEPPFTGTNAEVTAKHMRDNPAPLPRQLGIPRTVENVVIRAMSKDPQVRQSDALTLSRELAVALGTNASVAVATAVGEESTLKYEVPRPSSAIAGFYNLQDVDVALLKRSCEMAIERGYLKHIDVRSLLKELDSMGITRDELFDSLEILADENYIQPSKTVGGGLPVNDFEITEFGFEQYVNEYVPGYQAMVNRVIAEIIQDEKDVYDKPELIVEHVLDHLAAQGYLKLSKRIGGKIVIMHVSAQMRRQFERAALRPNAQPPKPKIFNELASQIGNELRFRARRDEWFFSEKGQASAKEEVARLHGHLRALAKEISENDHDVAIAVDADRDGFIVLRCCGLSMTSSWNPGRFANTLEGSVLYKKIFHGHLSAQPNVVVDEKPQQLSSTDYDIDMSSDGTIGWRNRNQRDDRLFSSQDLAESWLTDLMNQVQRNVIEQQSPRERH